MSIPPFQSEFASTAHGTVAHLAICGAKTLNIVGSEMLTAAKQAFAELLKRQDLRCITLTGVTEKAFIGGANLNEMRALNSVTAEPFIRSISNLCTAIRHAHVPTIAVMRGYCLGAGLEIAAACDVRIGDSSVQCGMPEVRVGLPSVVEAALLPGLIGWGKARELILRGHIIDAEESLAIGLLQHLTSSAELDRLRDRICADIAQSGPLAIAAQKRLFLAWEDQPQSVAIETGVGEFMSTFESDEPQRAIDAFFAHRNPPAVS